MIEVHLGDRQALDGTLKQAYENTRSGPIRFATDIPTMLIPAEYEYEETTGDLDAFNEATHVAGTVYKNGSKRGIKMTVAAHDTDTATDVEDELDEYRSVLTDQIDKDELTSALDAASISQNQSSVVVSYESSVSNLEEITAEIFEPSRRQEIPIASFTFDYTETNENAEQARDGAGYVKITHDGGDTINGNELYVRGAGFAYRAAVQADGEPIQYHARNANDSWADVGAEMSGEIDGDSAVVAGDYARVAVRSDYELAVVWESEYGDQSETLGKDTGPDA